MYDINRYTCTESEVQENVLVCLSANHRATRFSSLERLATLDAPLGTVTRAHDTIRGAVVLSTCNRFETYLDIDADDDHSPGAAVEAALSEIATRSGISYRELHDEVDLVAGNQVAHHLFSVAAGLDSALLGEGEIAGQVRRAYDDARQNGTTTRPLEHLFERASETSREVKSATRLGDSARSLVRLALDLASSRVADWTTARVILVGTGRYAAATLTALRARGAREVGVHSPSGRGAAFATRHGVALVEGDLADAAAHADVVVTCTNAAVLDRATLEAARAGAPGALLIVDLGMPRNVDDDVAGLPGIELLDLELVSRHAPLDEFAAVGDARAIVRAAAARHAAVRRVHEVAPAVVAMRSWVQGVLDSELARTAPTPESARALRHFTGVLLHHLIAQGHTLASRGEGERWADAVADVFPTPPPTPPVRSGR
jgi:glutamyl-tRNA reductase